MTCSYYVEEISRASAWLRESRLASDDRKIDGLSGGSKLKISNFGCL